MHRPSAQPFENIMQRERERVAARRVGCGERLPKSFTSNQGASLTSLPEKEQENACQTDMPVSQSPQVDSKFRGELCSSRVQAQDPFRDVAMATILQLANKWWLKEMSNFIAQAKVFVYVWLCSVLLLQNFDFLPIQMFTVCFAMNSLVYNVSNRHDNKNL